MPYRLLPGTFPGATRPSTVPILIAVVTVAIGAAIALRLFSPNASASASMTTLPAAVVPKALAAASAATVDDEARDATIRLHLGNARTRLLEASDQVQRAHRQAVTISADLDHWPYQTDRKRADVAAQACILALDQLERALEEVQTASMRKEQ